MAQHDSTDLRKDGSARTGEAIRMIALDLDGTLLNEEKHVSERSRRALAEANAAGVVVVPCSGRALDSIPAEVLGLTGVRYVVSSGGGAAFELATGKQLVCAPLDPRIVQEVLRLTWDAGAWGECYTGDRSFTPAKDIPVIRAFMRDRDFVYLDRQPVEDLSAWAAENADRVVKLNLMFRDDAGKERVRRQLAGRSDLLLTSASRHNLEVNAPNGGKGDALRTLGAKLGITPTQIMACGDQLNDLSMLRAVGFPVAMGNAVQAVKEAAAFVTRTNREDGVACAVERFVLGKLPE